MAKKHPCPIYCIYCGAKRRRDIVGHYCPSLNCQWQYGFSTCPVNPKHDENTEPAEEEKKQEKDEDDE